MLAHNLPCGRRGDSHWPHHQRRAHLDWLAYQMMQLYDRGYFTAGWYDRVGEPVCGSNIHNVDRRIVETHQRPEEPAGGLVRRRVSRQCRRRGESDENRLKPPQHPRSQRAHHRIRRRFATYKRADLILTDLDRLANLVHDRQRPIQIIFAGKAHPADNPGKELIRRSPTCGAIPASPGAWSRRGLRHQRLPAPGARGTCGSTIPAAPGASGTSGQKAVLKWRFETSRSSTAVGGSLRRHQRLRRRQGPLATSTTG